MKQIFFIIKSTCILLLLGYVQNTQAGSNKFTCALKSEQQFPGGLPEFSHNADPLFGYQCQLIPHYSGFLGNWFPALPHLSISQSKRLITSNNLADKATDDDTSKAWNIAFSIKRFGQSQLSVFAGQKDWQRVLQAKEAIDFIPENSQGVSDAITINQGQQARLNRKEEFFGFSFILPYQSETVLTELRIQKSIINQPIQANIPDFGKRSLFSAKTDINEVLIISQSFHRGLNINWQFGLGQGKALLAPQESIDFDDEQNLIISLRGQLELYYHYRINRHWFGHLGWKGDVHYWQQSTDDDNVQLAATNNMEQQVFLGIGLSF